MHLGKIVEIGAADEVMNAPKHPYTIKLLSAVPRVDGPARRTDHLIGQPG
jgi:peptide/nickel transport system ATP-binding protein